VQNLLNSMATSDGYDNFEMCRFIKEFQNPFQYQAFIPEMEEYSGSLWRFKDCVVGWNLGVSRYKGYVHLFLKESNSPTYMPFIVLEKVITIEQFDGQNIVIGIQVVNAEGAKQEHVHSIVVKVGDKRT
jgi:hypothetical protein